VFIAFPSVEEAVRRVGGYGAARWRRRRPARHRQAPQSKPAGQFGEHHAAKLLNRCLRLHPPTAVRDQLARRRNRRVRARRLAERRGAGLPRSLRRQKAQEENHIADDHRHDRCRCHRQGDVLEDLLRSLHMGTAPPAAWCSQYRMIKSRMFTLRLDNNPLSEMFTNSRLGWWFPAPLAAGGVR